MGPADFGLNRIHVIANRAQMEIERKKRFHHLYAVSAECLSRKLYFSDRIFQGELMVEATLHHNAVEAFALTSNAAKDHWQNASLWLD
jgi:hypothetical protein